MKPGAIDYIILSTYFLYVLGIGWLVKKRIKTGVDFLTSAQSIPGVGHQSWPLSLPTWVPRK